MSRTASTVTKAKAPDALPVLPANISATGRLVLDNATMGPERSRRSWSAIRSTICNGHSLTALGYTVTAHGDVNGRYTVARADDFDGAHTHVVDAIRLPDGRITAECDQDCVMFCLHTWCLHCEGVVVLIEAAERVLAHAFGVPSSGASAPARDDTWPPVVQDDAAPADDYACDPEIADWLTECERRQAAPARQVAPVAPRRSYGFGSPEAFAAARARDFD